MLVIIFQNLSLKFSIAQFKNFSLDLVYNFIYINKISNAFEVLNTLRKVNQSRFSPR